MLQASKIDTTRAAETGRFYSLASWLRPDSYWTVMVYHFPLALITAAILLLPYGVTLEQVPKIPCTFLLLTGYPCPFCGFSRAFWAISAGYWSAAWSNCPLSFAVYFSVWVVFLWNGAALVWGVVLSRGPALQLSVGYRRKAVIVILLLLAANWIYRISIGLDVA